MSHAYIYDHVRTPRGKGKKDGSLHQASPVWLLSTLLRSKVAEGKLEVTTSGFTACELPPPEFGSRLYYRAKVSARGLKCEPIGKYPIGNWKQ